MNLYGLSFEGANILNYQAKLIQENATLKEKLKKLDRESMTMVKNIEASFELKKADLTRLELLAEDRVQKCHKALKMAQKNANT